MKAMEKFPIIIYAGAAMLAWSAGKMIVEDKIIGGFVPSTALHLAVQVILTIAVVGIGYMKNKKMKKNKLTQLKKERTDHPYALYDSG